MWVAGSPKLEHKQPEEREREREKKTFIILTHTSELSDRTEWDWIATQNLVRLPHKSRDRFGLPNVSPNQ
jgi:hypothetical protein